MDMLKVLCMTFVLALAALLIMAAIRDSRTYIIDNKTVIAVLVLALLFHAVQIMMPAEARLYADPADYHLKSLMLALVVFAVTTGLFAIRVMGGGDVKLITVMMFWAGPTFAPGFLLLTAIAGGIVSAIVLVRHRLQKRPIAKVVQPEELQPEASLIVNHLDSIITASDSPIDSRCSVQGPRVKVPYGLGICAGGLYVVWMLLQRLTITI